MLRRKLRRAKKKITVISLCIFAVLISYAISYFPNNHLPSWDDIFSFFNLSANSGNSFNDIKEYDMSVHYLNVGKADSIYIKCKDKNILIDAADVDTKDTVCEYLKKNHVKDLDLVMVSHPHRDHIGEMSKIASKFNIKRFIMPKVPDDITPTFKTYESMLDALYQNDIQIEKPIAGDSFMIGDMLIEIFAPAKGYEEMNNNSIVAKITYGENSFLFVGDCQKEEEYDLISSKVDLTADVLKVGHHGSKTSTTQKFLNAVKPKYAVITVGKDSSNLPKQSTIDRLNSNNIKTYRTDTNGTVVFLTNGHGLNIVTQK